MATVIPDEHGAVSIPPDMLREIGVAPHAPVTLEVEGDVILVHRPGDSALDVEIYTPERKAEFLLNGAVNAADAVAAVRELGLDPEKIPHDRPPGGY